MSEDLSRYISGYFGTQDIYRINRLWGERAPILQLGEDDKIWGESELRRLGLNEGQWFVCVHVREGSYIPKNEVIQAHRNGKIENWIPSMQEIVRRGGVCIRMGDPGMVPLPSIPGVVDYAHSSAKSDRLDVVLCAWARFLVSSNWVNRSFSVSFSGGIAMFPDYQKVDLLLEVSDQALYEAKRRGRNTVVLAK